MAGRKGGREIEGIGRNGGRQVLDVCRVEGKGLEDGGSIGRQGAR